MALLPQCESHSSALAARFSAPCRCRLYGNNNLQPSSDTSQLHRSLVNTAGDREGNPTGRHPCQPWHRNGCVLGSCSADSARHRSASRSAPHLLRRCAYRLPVLRGSPRKAEPGHGHSHRSQAPLPHTQGQLHSRQRQSGRQGSNTSLGRTRVDQTHGCRLAPARSVRCSQGAQRRALERVRAGGSAEGEHKAQHLHIRIDQRFRECQHKFSF